MLDVIKDCMQLNEPTINFENIAFFCTTILHFLFVVGLGEGVVILRSSHIHFL